MIYIYIYIYMYIHKYIYIYIHVYMIPFVWMMEHMLEIPETIPWIPTERNDMDSMVDKPSMVDIHIHIIVAYFMYIP